MPIAQNEPLIKDKPDPRVEDLVAVEDALLKNSNEPISTMYKSMIKPKRTIKPPRPKKGKKFVTTEKMLSIVEQVNGGLDAKLVEKQAKEHAYLKALSARQAVAERRKKDKEGKFEKAKDEVKRKRFDKKGKNAKFGHASDDKGEVEENDFGAKKPKWRANQKSSNGKRFSGDKRGDSGKKPFVSGKAPKKGKRVSFKN